MKCRCRQRKNWHWIHSIWWDGQRLLCFNSINIKATAVQAYKKCINKSTHHSFLPLLSLPIGPELQRRKKLHQLILTLFFFSFFFPFYSRDPNRGRQNETRREFYWKSASYGSKSGRVLHVPRLSFTRVRAPPKKKGSTRECKVPLTW